MAVGAAVLFVLGTAIGLVLAWLTGPVLLIVGAGGIVIGLFYSALKYHALGDLAVFLNFGLLGSLGAWVVQTQSFSWLPVIWTVPMAMLVIAILHANNWRDTITDRERKVKTMASLLGDKGSLFYYAFLLFGSMTIIFGLILIPRVISPSLTPMPLTFFLVWLAFPHALQLWRRAVRRREPRRPMDFIILDGATANYNLLFGILCTAAVWLQYLLRLR